ncbi:MAG: SprB repeat-containing protein, partial [Bacteroidales bacterium]|nr:SprB repeat-containing protein [Bacteroidales bacterium]
MKNENLFQTNAQRVCTLLLVFLLSLCPWFVQAQNYDEEGYVSNGGFKTLIGTPDTRLMASVYETDSTVTMKLMSVGFIKANMIDFAFFYDPEVLRLCNQNLQPVEDFNDLQAHTATLDPFLTSKNWQHWGSHKNVGSSFILNNVSGHQSMRSIWYDLAYIGLDPNNLFKVDSGRVQKILEFNFLKQTKGADLVNDAIGIGVKTTSVGSNYYQPKFGYDGLFLWYRDVEFSIDNRIINKNLFLYRSGSSVKTEPANNIGPSFATLHGSFLQGKENLPVSTTILDTTGSVRVGTGRLNHDDVKQYGFIYSLSNVNILIDEFSDFIKIENTNYPVPTALEIAAGTFTRGGYTFDIVIVNNNNGVNETVNYDTQVTGLMPNQAYYAWAYKHYSFETSDDYQSVGNRITFTTTDCIALNIGTVFTVEEPICGQDNGKIQMFVTGGSGSYEFSVNGGTFETYTDDIIDGLAAGTYSITVRDLVQTSCPTATVNDIVLHNSTTDLHLVATSGNASTCESTDGTLFISVTGGEAPYTFYLDGVEQSVSNGEISGLMAGVYVVDVEDKNGCLASGGEVRITASNSQLAANIIAKVNTECGMSNGSVSFTVTGSNNFKYQLDGFPEENGNDNSQIDITGLTAGEHILRVWDNCKEVVQKITITNGTNGLAFTAETTNEIMSCDGSLVGGSITLTVTNGTPVFKYRIDGGDWISFSNSLSTFTISDLHTGIYRVELIDNTNCTYEVNKITIKREIYKPINVGTIFALVEPTCGLPNGEIQVFATGGSGSYLYSINGG